MDTDGNIRCLSELLVRPFCLETLETGSGGILGLTLLFIIFVICGAYFGGAESGFSAMNKIRIKAKAEDGNRAAKNAMAIANDFDRALTTLLIGNNITHIAAASVATLIATRRYGSSETVTVLCTVITTVIVFLCSEMIPKAFANDRSETTALFSAGSLRFLMKLFSPLTVFFTKISSGFAKLLQRFIKSEEEPSMTEEELYDLIDTIEEEGVLNEEQGDLFKSAMDFSGTCAKDVMTMRGDIRAVDVHLSNEEILKIVRITSHSRLPVFDGDLDHIIGTLQIRVFIKEYLKNNALDIRSLLIPAFRVPPESMIDDLLSEMQQHKCYLAVVSDADGKTLGLVTIEDFLEELVGEIWDEDEIVDKNFIKLGGNRFRVNPKLTAWEIGRRMGLSSQTNKGPRRSLISVIIEHFGAIPNEEEAFLFGDWEITVDTVENHKITAVVVRILSDEEKAAKAQPSLSPEKEGGDA